MKRRNYLMALLMLTIGTANASNFVTIKGDTITRSDAFNIISEPFFIFRLFILLIFFPIPVQKYCKTPK